MREADLDAVMKVENRSYPHPWSRGTMRDCLHAGYSAWVMEHGHDIVAYAVLSFGPGEVHLLTLCVDPDVQSKGLGRKMLRAMMRMAKLRNVDQMLLEVRPSNTAAVALYNSESFNEIGRRPRYYPAANGTREDAIVMAIELSVTTL